MGEVHAVCPPKVFEVQADLVGSKFHMRVVTIRGCRCSNGITNGLEDHGVGDTSVIQDSANTVMVR